MPSGRGPIRAPDEAWARSYARQALSDLTAREILVNGEREKCHRLHFLQMAAEKTCKAHLVNANGHENVRKSHAYIAKTLPIIARDKYSRMTKPIQIAHWQMEEIKRLAREIELLAPACDDGDSRRDNSEYPWLGGHGEVCTPCDYKFPKIDDGSRSIILLIKLIRTAAESHST